MLLLTLNFIKNELKHTYLNVFFKPTVLKKANLCSVKVIFNVKKQSKFSMKENHLQSKKTTRVFLV